MKEYDLIDRIIGLGAKIIKRQRQVANPKQAGAILKAGYSKAGRPQAQTSSRISAEMPIRLFPIENMML